MTRYQYILKVLAFLFLGFCQFQLMSQSAEDDYTPLKASGNLPHDFLVLSEDRYLQALENDPDLNNANRKVREKFHLSANFALNRLLYSGQVLFNEPTSDYINLVADKVLANEPELRQKLRFYTIKDAQANAFTTGQGVIFVTLGLLAQLENEAQLAAVLSHEVVHYVNKHSINGFEEKEGILGSRKYRRMGPQNAIAVLSKFSKDKEYEADVSGFQNYFLESGYDTEVFRTVFDVLHYSYLPFSQAEVMPDLLESDYQYFSKKLSKDSVKSINILNEDFDDSRSSHPNTYSRKLRIKDELSLLENETGGELFLVSKDYFMEVRKMARFEILRLRLQDLEYGKALYEALALQKEYPNSSYLEKSIVKTLYGAAKYKNDGAISQVVQNYKNVEGASQATHFFLRKVSKKTLNTLALLKSAEYEIKHPEDAYISSLVDDLILESEEEVGLSFSFFKTIDKATLKAALFPEEVIQYRDSLPSDTIGLGTPIIVQNDADSLKTETPGKPLSKYEIIDLQRTEVKDDKDKFKVADAEYRYAFSKLLEQHEFEERWNVGMSKSKLNTEDENRPPEDYRKQAKQNRIEKRHGLALGIDSLVLVNPLVFQLDKQGEMKLIESERLQLEFEEVLEENAGLLGMDLKSYSSKNVDIDGILDYNVMSQYTAFMNEFYNHADGMDIIPAEADFVDDFIESTGSDKVFTSILITGRGRQGLSNSLYNSGLALYTLSAQAAILITLATVHPVLGAAYLGYLIRPKHYTYLNAAILDMRSGEVIYDLSYESKRNASNAKMRALLYELLYQTHRNP